MTASTKLSTTSDHFKDHETSRSKVSGHRIDMAFQVALLWVLSALIWRMIGPVRQNVWENRLQLSFVCLGCFTAAGLWIVDSNLSRIVKAIGISVCFFVALSIGFLSDRDFYKSVRVLEPARIVQQRIVHDGIGLSYAVLPNYQVKLQPVMMRTKPYRANKKSELPTRIQFGEIVALSQMIKVPKHLEESYTRAAVSLQIGHELDFGLNAFVLEVQQIESKIAASADIKFIQHTHPAKVAGLDGIEFEFVNMRQHLISKYVFLHVGTYLANFVLSTSTEADRPTFDEFLKTIKLDSNPLN